MMGKFQELKKHHGNLYNIMTDPIADMLNRIKNSQAVSKETVLIPFSKIKYEVALILEKSNFIKKVDKKGRKNNRVIEVFLKYDKDLNPAISGLKRVSKPGQRIYSSWNKLRKVKQGYGLGIVSTSKGVKTYIEARKNKLGGERICEIW